MKSELLIYTLFIDSKKSSSLTKYNKHKTEQKKQKLNFKNNFTD